MPLNPRIEPMAWGVLSLSAMNADAIKGRIIHLVSILSDRAESDLVRILEQDSATTASKAVYGAILNDMLDEGTIIVSLGQSTGPLGVKVWEPCYRMA